MMIAHSRFLAMVTGHASNAPWTYKSLRVGLYIDRPSYVPIIGVITFGLSSTDHPSMTIFYRRSMGGQKNRPSLGSHLRQAAFQIVHHVIEFVHLLSLLLARTAQNVDGDLPRQFIKVAPFQPELKKRSNLTVIDPH